MYIDVATKDLIMFRNVAIVLCVSLASGGSVVQADRASTVERHQGLPVDDEQGPMPSDRDCSLWGDPFNPWNLDDPFGWASDRAIKAPCRPGESYPVDSYTFQSGNTCIFMVLECA